jgi:hypothetical protein
MRYLSLSQVLELHRRIIEQSGGMTGILDLGVLASALWQPRMVQSQDNRHGFIIHIIPAIISYSRKITVLASMAQQARLLWAVQGGLPEESLMSSSGGCSGKSFYATRLGHFAFGYMDSRGYRINSSRPALSVGDVVAQWVIIQPRNVSPLILCSSNVP